MTVPKLKAETVDSCSVQINIGPSQPAQSNTEYCMVTSRVSFVDTLGIAENVLISA